LEPFDATPSGVSTSTLFKPRARYFRMNLGYEETDRLLLFKKDLG
jgi:hypothetical protein